MPKIIVKGRVDARTYLKKSTIHKTVIISINVVSEAKNQFDYNPNILDVLYLAFDDEESGQYAMTQEQANDICRFVEQWEDKVENLYENISNTPRGIHWQYGRKLQQQNSGPSCEFNANWNSTSTRCRCLVKSVLR